MPPSSRTSPRHFNPRPPWGGRQQAALPRHSLIRISIHALRGEGDREKPLFATKYGISIHALRGEGDSRTYS